MTTRDDKISRYGVSLSWGTLAAGGLLIGAVVAILAGASMSSARGRLLVARGQEHRPV
jgi:hypothetical protein